MHVTIGRLNGKFVATWSEGGRRRRYRLGTSDVAVATARAEEIRIRLTQAHGPDVSELWALYCESLAGRASMDVMPFVWRALEPAFGRLKAHEVSDALVQSYIAGRRAQGRSDNTILNEITRLQSALRWAARKGFIDKAPLLPRPRKPAPADYHITKADARRLVAAASAPHVRLAIHLMLATGARRGAALELTWDRVDLDRRLIMLAAPGETVRKRRATVPINDTLMAELVAARSIARTQWVVEYAGQRVRNVRTGFARAAEQAGVPDCTPHVLRHSAAVWMAEDGVPMAEISQYLGHSSTAITERVYARFSPDYLRSAARSLDF